jgi:hypothetical protein
MIYCDWCREPIDGTSHIVHWVGPKGATARLCDHCHALDS